MDYHPEDPTTPLWEHLLRRKPEGHKRKSPSKADRKKVSAKLKKYYKNNVHPRTEG